MIRDITHEEKRGEIIHRKLFCSELYNKKGVLKEYFFSGITLFSFNLDNKHHIVITKERRIF